VGGGIRLIVWEKGAMLHQREKDNIITEKGRSNTFKKRAAFGGGGVCWVTVQKKEIIGTLNGGRKNARHLRYYDHRERTGTLDTQKGGVPPAPRTSMEREHQSLRGGGKKKSMVNILPEQPKPLRKLRKRVAKWKKGERLETKGGPHLAPGGTKTIRLQAFCHR